jgi:KaiC/GvpD/RAD55 family RecA-like ATPase
MEFTRSEVRAYYTSRFPNIAWGSSKEIRTACPVHGGSRPSFAIDTETGLAHCFSSCSKGWDMLGLEMELQASKFPAAKRSVFRIIGRPAPTQDEENIEATFDYQRRDGTVAYQVVRLCGKQFKQRRPNGIGGWIWDLKGVSPLLFHLPQLLDAEFVWIVEGEKDVLTMERNGQVATCNSAGAGKFGPELAPWFAGKRVAILPDFDQTGRDHAVKVAEILQPVAASVRIVELPGLPNKGDVSDFLTLKGTRFQDVLDAYQQAQEWTPEWEFWIPLRYESDKYIRTLEQEIEAEGGLEKFWDFTLHEGVHTPFHTLTKNLGGGMRAGEVYVLGADQGSGKTSLALQFATKAMQSRKGVLFYSLEMGWRDVFQRLVAIHARVDLLDLQWAQRAHQTVTGIVDSLNSAARELMAARLLVNVKTGITPDYLVEECDRLKKNERIDLVIVDHMQLMASTGNVRGDYEKFTSISRAMKETAKAINCPVLLVSQTSRTAFKDHRPELDVSDLRGSGAIEEDAAAVLLLYADYEDAKRAKENHTFAKGPVRTWLKIGKNRYGMAGNHLELQHFKSFTRFDMAAHEGRE